ncbi:MAG TPA: excinuclease ABC subunit UvrA [Thermodesulfobacteriota bacterium]|nr:excinuclease ABC subunit UvrA [Thermodesulfobacteriota bacterium]
MEGEIRIEGARENNLKNITVSIPWHKFTVVTGLSGSGKSSLALDTLYAEGLRRYIECLSTYARQFLERVDRPDMDDISGLPPAVAIESRNNVRNSRSTVGTTTEVYDYLRLLFAKVGRIFCPECGREVRHRSPGDIAGELLGGHEGKRALITFPPGNLNLTPAELLSNGFTRIISGGDILEVEGLSKVPRGSEIVLDRLVLDKKSRSRIVGSLELAFEESRHVNVRILDGETLRYSADLECPACHTRLNEPTPLLFSFNSPQGACPECKGFGNILGLDPDLVIPNPEKSLSQGAIEPLTKPSLKPQMRKLLHFAEEKGIYTDKPYNALADKEKDLIFEGGAGFPGVRGYFRHLEEKNYKMHVRVFLSKYRSAFTCDACLGSRLVKEALWVKVGGKNIYELSLLPIDALGEFFKELELSDYERQIAHEIMKQIKSRIDFLVKVGLEYLTLGRLSKTLSGGEAQRVNLACQLGATLTETLYIMDEPSIGLHPRDVARLVSLIKELRDRDNTVVVVEHDFEMIKSADNIIELGPLAGERGGDIVYQGEVSKLLNGSADSLTKRYITGRSKIEPPLKRRKGSGKSITVTGAVENNLKNLTVSFPLRTFICVTGVSGSGKSSLVNDVIYSALARKFRGEVERVGKYGEIKGAEHLSDVIMLDQNPIGRSSRSNPVTYIKAYDEIRKTMAGTWQARSKGLTPTHFSFNVPGGRCETCEGEGVQQIEMHFLADVFVTCEECGGKRFNKDVLSIRYRDRNIDEILSLTVNEAINFFYETPVIGRKLMILQDVGLGYIRLGQSAPTLSGGEAQRIKIARELGRKGGKDILYILDEPTVGLHAEDVRKLLEVINKLVLAGNTILVVEHNLDVIKSADYVLDLGPEGGDEGGYIIARGTPEEVSKSDKSHTGKYLRQALVP